MNITTYLKAIKLYFFSLVSPFYCSKNDGSFAMNFNLMRRWKIKKSRNFLTPHTFIDFDTFPRIFMGILLSFPYHFCCCVSIYTTLNKYSGIIAKPIIICLRKLQNTYYNELIIYWGWKIGIFGENWYIIRVSCYTLIYYLHPVIFDSIWIIFLLLISQYWVG